MSLWPSKSVALKTVWPSKKCGPQKSVALGLQTMSLRSQTMPARCFDQTTVDFLFHHPPFREGMIPRSLQYEFCYFTPALSPTAHLLSIHQCSFFLPQDLLPALVNYTVFGYHVMLKCSVTKCLMSLLVSESVSTHSQQRAFLTHPTHYRRPPIVWKHSHSYGRQSQMKM